MQVWVRGRPSAALYVRPSGPNRASLKSALLGSVASIITAGDTVPNAFSFTDQTNVGNSQLVSSNSITPTGYTAPTTISITGGQYEINGNNVWLSTAGTISPGQSVKVRHTSSATSGGSISTTLTIGGISDTFTSTTAAADTVPDAFSFTDQTNVAAGSVRTSNSITPTGYNAAATISITGGEYELDGSGTWLTASGTINPGQSVRVRHTASASTSSTVNTVLTIGGVSDTFSSTTAAAAADTTPNAFGFTDVTNVATSSVITSNSITPTGYDTPSPISITGGEYELDGSGTWLTASGTITPGQSVRVRHTSSASNTTTVNTVLTIGGVSDTFSSTTAAPLTVFVPILAGQSNMEGRSNTRDPLVDTDVANVYQFPGYGGTDGSGNLLDPNYRTITSDITPLRSVDPYAGGSPSGIDGDRVGPGEYIARQLLTDNPGCKVLLVPCAVGGTTLVTGTPKWNSSATPGAGGTLFENMITHSNLAIAAAQSQWPGATIIPQFYWIQGEFDAGNFVTRAAYLAALTDLISRARARITGAASAPFNIGSMIPMKWLIGSPNYNPDYANVNAAHVDASVDLTNVHYIRGPGTGTTGSTDFLHYSPVDQVRDMGTRMGAVMSDTVGPTMTSPATFSNQTGVALSLPLTCSDQHATFHINGGANAAQFEISDRYLSPVLRWVGNGTGPAAGNYVVGVRARDGAGNYGPTQNVTITVSAVVSPSTFFTSGEKGIVWDLEAGNVFQNIDGTTAANVGDPVGWVRDQSGNNNHWIAAANNTTRPTLQLNAFGKRVLRFNGTTQILFAATPFADPQVRRAFTAGVAVKGAAPGTNRDIVSAASTSSVNQFYVPLQATGAGAIAMSMRNDAGGGPGVVPSLPTTMLDGATTHIITSDYNGPSGANSMHDANDRDTADGDDGWVSANQGTLSGPITLTRSSLGGRGGATPSAFFNGDIGPGYVINRDLSALEMSSGENWIDSLIGVGLP